jgi:L-fuconolactonase
MIRSTFTRRSFVATTAIAASLDALRAQPAPIPIIDTHIHFFDTSIPQPPNPGGGRGQGGAGFSGGAGPGGRGGSGGLGNAGGRGGSGPRTGMAGLSVADPKKYREVIAGFGIVGAIEIEASSSLAETDRVLTLAQTDPIMVGTVGTLQPESPDFRNQLDRLHKNPLFRGIRYGNLWGFSLPAMVDNAEFIAGMKYFASNDLIMDTANPRPNLIEAVVRLTDKVPDLRVMLDHLPNLTPPTDSDQLKAYEDNLRELAKRKVYVKVSEVAQRVDGSVPTDIAYYKPRLDMIYDIFGEDKVVFGSDWPNSSGNWVTFDAALSLVRQYFMAKGRSVAEKYFWKNSIAAYKWVKRDPSQPALS